MAVLHVHVHVSALLLVAVSMVSCRVDCPYGRYYDEDSRECEICSPCPRDVISGESQDFTAMYECRRYKSLCPRWCSVATSLHVSDPNEGKDKCEPVPFVNVTIEEPLFNATTNAYTASCSAFFSNMGAPSLEWSDPSGQVLAPTDASGKWNVQQGQVTQDALSQGPVTLQINDFQKEDEGNYTCSAQGEQSANQTIFLKYVEPPVTTNTPSTSMVPPNMALPNTAPPNTTPDDSSEVTKATAGEVSTPTGGTSKIVLVVAVIIAIIIAILVCAFVAWCVIRRKNRSSRSRVLVDLESHPLNGTNVVNGLTLEESDDFKSATVVGIQTCFCQYNCSSVIIKHNKKNHKVQSGQNKFFIEHMAWDDSIEVYAKYCGKKKKERIKILKMNCLKIENITETSAVVRCPSDEDTFYCHFEEKDASGESSNRESGELVRGGRKQINLRPQMAYCVHLGVRGRTGDSGPINWVWKETFETKGITVNRVSPGESSATLRLTGHSIPGSLLYYMINGSDPKEMTSTEMQISSLIPGMHQLLQIKVKEDIEGSTNYRLLKKIPFKTTGSVQNGGDYIGHVTTDFDGERGSSAMRRKLRKRQREVTEKTRTKPLTCDTGLLEAIHTLRDDTEYQQVYLHTPQSVLKAVLDSLVEFLKDFKDIVPTVPPNLSTNRRLRGLDHIESFMKQFAMQDYTGIFDLLKRFIQKQEVHSPEGIDFAECLLKVHYTGSTEKCRICRHAVYILKSYERKDIDQSSEC